MASLTSRAGHKQWLIVTGLVIAAFGPIFALATVPATDGLATWTLNLLNGPGGDSEQFRGTAQFLTALTGGFLFGWGVMIFALRAWVYDLAPEGVRRSVLVGVLAWFVLDSLGSIASGNPWNALINVAVLLVGVGPMWRSATDA